MIWYRYHLHFPGGLHLSRGVANDYGTSVDVLHSDVLYAAIIQAWAELGLEQCIPVEADAHLGFACTSAFPYLKVDDKHIHFYPKPYSLLTQSNEPADIAQAKKWKKMQWLEESVFYQWLEQLPERLDPAYLQDAYFCNDRLATCDWVKPITAEIQSRNAWNGENVDTRPFYMERKRFINSTTHMGSHGGQSKVYQSGLYFIACFESETIKSNFDTALSHLSESGLGSDRTVGNGYFSWQASDYAPPQVSNANYAVSLSLLLPDNNQFEQLLPAEDDTVGYELELRGGWISSPYMHLRKKQVYMLDVGTVVKQPQPVAHTKPFTLGKAVDLRPSSIQRPVFRHGISILFPVKR